MVFPGGAFTNLEHFGGRLTRSRPLTDPEAMLLFDPQTSGGLLVAVPAAGAAEFTGTLRSDSEEAWRVGQVVAGGGIEIA